MTVHCVDPSTAIKGRWENMIPELWACTQGSTSSCQAILPVAQIMPQTQPRALAHISPLCPQCWGPQAISSHSLSMWALLSTTSLSQSHHLFPALHHRHLPVLVIPHTAYRVLGKFKQDPVLFQTSIVHTTIGSPRPTGLPD